MEIIPDRRRLAGLVEQAREGKLCLPNFQRDFIWPREDVADLLRSVLRRYYVGSLLFLRCDPAQPPFAPTFLRGANSPLKEPRPDILVLDGQQRLTAFLYALTAPDLPLKDTNQRRWFFVDLKLLLNDPENNEIVFERSKKDLDGLDQPANQFKQRILPCTRLLSMASFLEWRDDLDDWLQANEPEALQDFRTGWRKDLTLMVNNFQTFEIPLVELPLVDEADTEAIGRVCAIFEKLNSTGVDLSVYDLLTARLYRSGIKLHDLWEQACADNARLREWSQGKADVNKFGVLVLRTLALLRDLDPKPRILINLSPVDFEKDWKRATAAMERALELVTNVGQDGFGVFDRKWLPGFGLIPTLAALRCEIEERKLGQQEREDLRRWYWSNVFLERYSSAVESKSRKDYSDMLNRWKAGKDEPDVFKLARQRIGAAGYTVRDSASYASSVYSGIFCLLALNQARDWRRQEAIQLQDLQDHHIFPQAYLKRHGLTVRNDVNSIVNRTLISDETNGLISDEAPADYLTDKKVFPAGATSALLEPHFISPNVFTSMGMATEPLTPDEAKLVYDEFRQAREAAIVAEIRRVCGIV